MRSISFNCAAILVQSHLSAGSKRGGNRGAALELLATSSPLLREQPSPVVNDLSVYHPHNGPHRCSLSFTECQSLNSPHQPFVPDCLMFFGELIGVALYGILLSKWLSETARAGIF